MKFQHIQKPTITLSLKQRVIRAIVLPAWIFVSFFAVQLVLSLVAVGLEKVGVPLGTVSPALLNTIFALLVYIVTIIVVVGVPYLVQKRRTSAAELGYTRLPTWTDILLAPSGFIVYVVLSSILLWLCTAIPGFETGQVQDTGFSNVQGTVGLLLAFFTLVVLAPVAEETLFRGYLLGKLRKAVPTWAAILITSALFGICHVAFSSNADWPLMVDTFALSILLCSLRVVSGSLWASIMLHMIKNGIAFYILFLSPLISHTIGG